MITKHTPRKEILKLSSSCNCTACQHGCSMGSGFLENDDVKKIADYLKMSESQMKNSYLEEVEIFNKKLLRPKNLRNNKPYGPCIFFDSKKGCSIHPVKPLQCKITMNCKPYAEELQSWFLLNSILNPYDPESMRQFAIYLENGGKTLKGGALQELIPNKETRKKILNYEILK